MRRFPKAVATLILFPAVMLMSVGALADPPASGGDLPALPELPPPLPPIGTPGVTGVSGSAGTTVGGMPLPHLGSLAQLPRSNGGRVNPMIEVGGGMETSGAGLNVLLRVGFGIRRTANDRQPGDIFGPEQMIWAHITGDFAINPSEVGNRLPYMDIRFIPVHNQLSIVSDSQNQLMGDLQALPMRVTRNINVDQSAAVRIGVLGVSFGGVRMMNSKVALFAQLAADALGYKMAMHVSNLGTFHGVHLVDLSGEAGVALNMRELLHLKQDFMIRIAAGGQADINLGGNTGPTGFAVQSDMRAYLAIRADIFSWLQLFVQGGYNAACNSAHTGCNGSPQFMVGAIFLF